MEIKLTKKPKNPIIIQGFPGFGMVGAISAEFLIQHLNTELIGRIILEKAPAIAAIHEGKFVEPFGIFYNKKYNVVVFHATAPVMGHEWELSQAVVDIARQLKAKEIISLEGVGSVSQDESGQRTFYYATTEAHKKKLKAMKLEPLNEGIILGITAALLVKAEDIPVACIFSETHNEMPDSKAAAKVIEILDKYLKLHVDYKPLLVMAEQFENKLKGIMQQSQQAQDDRDKKAMSYVG
jgi:uncharacterized protein